MDKLLEDACIKPGCGLRSSGYPRGDDGRVDRPGRRNPKVLAQIGTVSDARNADAAAGGVRRPLGTPAPAPADPVLPPHRGRSPNIAAVDEQDGGRCPLSLEAATPGFWRSPASGRSPPRSSSPRSGPTCRDSPPQDICVRGPSSHRASTPRQVGPRATASTGHGNRYLARILGEAAVGGRPYRHLPGRTLPAHCPTARQKTRHRRRRALHPRHRLAPTGRRGHPLSPTSVPITSPNTQTQRSRNTTTSANSKPSATPSPSPQRPDQTST